MSEPLYNLVREDGTVYARHLTFDQCLKRMRTTDEILEIVPV